MNYNAEDNYSFRVTRKPPKPPKKSWGNTTVALIVAVVALVIMVVSPCITNYDVGFYNWFTLFIPLIGAGIYSDVKRQGDDDD